MGHVYLDAYHANGDERFYEAAFRTAMAVKQAQRPEGGWNYIHDFQGEGSLKHWYDTIGRNGRRLEEFRHCYGNATFDDAGTAVASQFKLRMYLEKGDERVKNPVRKAIDFILDAQFGPELPIANGGCPSAFRIIATRSRRCRCQTHFSCPRARRLAWMTATTRRRTPRRPTSSNSSTTSRSPVTASICITPVTISGERPRVRRRSRPYTAVAIAPRTAH